MYIGHGSCDESIDLALIWHCGSLEKSVEKLTNISLYLMLCPVYDCGNCISFNTMCIPFEQTGCGIVCSDPVYDI